MVPGWADDCISRRLMEDTSPSMSSAQTEAFPGRLTTGPFVDKRPTFSRDGQSIYFPSNRSGSDEIWKIPAGGGDPVQITPNGEGRDVPKESPDGKFLYYMKGWPRQCSVWKMPVGGGEETMVLDSVHADGQWAFWKEGIYFFRPADAKGHSDMYLNSSPLARQARSLRSRSPSPIASRLRPTAGRFCTPSWIKPAPT